MERPPWYDATIIQSSRGIDHIQKGFGINRIRGRLTNAHRTLCGVTLTAWMDERYTSVSTESDNPAICPRCIAKWERIRS